MTDGGILLIEYAKLKRAVTLPPPRPCNFAAVWSRLDHCRTGILDSQPIRR